MSYTASFEVVGKDFTELFERAHELAEGFIERKQDGDNTLYLLSDFDAKPTTLKAGGKVALWTAHVTILIDP